MAKVQIATKQPGEKTAREKWWRARGSENLYKSDGEGCIDVEDKGDLKELRDAGLYKGKVKEKPKVDYTSWNKDKLIESCEDRGLDTDGNKDDLIARIVENDG